MKRNPNPAHRDLLLVCSTGGHLLQLVALRESWAALHTRLGDVRQERRPLAARRRATSSTRTARRTATSRTCSGTSLVAWRVVGDDPAQGRADDRRRRRGSLRLGRPAARREGRLRREPGADRRPVAQLPADRSDRKPRATCSGRSSPRALRGTRFAGNVFSADRVIFVSVGTNEAPFDRLLRAVASLPLDEDVVVQHGHSRSARSAGARLLDFLSLRGDGRPHPRARVVVTHAGVGSVMVSLANGKRPVVVPRRKRFAGGRRRPPAPARPAASLRPASSRSSRSPTDSPLRSRATSELATIVPSDELARCRHLTTLPQHDESRVRRRAAHDPTERAADGLDRLPHPQRHRLEGSVADRRCRSRGSSSRSCSRACSHPRTGVSRRWCSSSRASSSCSPTMPSARR